MRNVRSNIELDEIETEYNKCLDYPVLGTLMEHFVTHTPLNKASMDMKQYAAMEDLIVATSFS